MLLVKTINHYKSLIIKCLIYVRFHKIIKKMIHCHKVIKNRHRLKTANPNHNNLKHSTLHPKMAKFSKKNFRGCTRPVSLHPATTPPVPLARFDFQ